MSQLNAPLGKYNHTIKQILQRDEYTNAYGSAMQHRPPDMLEIKRVTYQSHSPQPSDNRLILNLPHVPKNQQFRLPQFQNSEAKVSMHRQHSRDVLTELQRRGLITDKRFMIQDTPARHLSQRMQDQGWRHQLPKVTSVHQLNPELREKSVLSIVATKTQVGYLPQVRKVNQDSSLVYEGFADLKHLHMLGVMDGHGQYGHLVSQFVKAQLPSILQSSIQGYKSGDDFLKSDCHSIIKQSFTMCQDRLDKISKIDAYFSGTTCVVCLVSKSTLICANTGDSRAIMCSEKDGRWTCTQLSRDHKPEENDEAARIRMCGGRIEQSRLQPGQYAPGLRAGQPFGPQRVWLKNKQMPGLAMTRSIGDMCVTQVGVTAEPEIKQFELKASDKFIVMASDGIWDRLSNLEVMMTIVNNFYQQRDANGAASKLVREAKERWQNEQGMCDDITIVIAFLDVEQQGVVPAVQPQL